MSEEDSGDQMARVIREMDAEIARLTRERDELHRQLGEAEEIIDLAREFTDANGLARGLGGHYGLREVIRYQMVRAETAEKERDEARGNAERYAADIIRVMAQRDEVRELMLRACGERDAMYEAVQKDIARHEARVSELERAAKCLLDAPCESNGACKYQHAFYCEMLVAAKRLRALLAPEPVPLSECKNAECPIGCPEDHAVFYEDDDPPPGKPWDAPVEVPSDPAELVAATEAVKSRLAAMGVRELKCAEPVCGTCGGDGEVNEDCALCGNNPPICSCRTKPCPKCGAKGEK